MKSSRYKWKSIAALNLEDFDERLNKYSEKGYIPYDIFTSKDMMLYVAILYKDMKEQNETS